MSPRPVIARPAGRPVVSPGAWALLAVAFAVLAANLPYLLGLLDLNPLDFRAGLTSTITPGLVSGKPVIDPAYGFFSQALGHLAALDLLHLHPPWWNPYEGTGMPLLGETQAAALFPLTLLTAFSNGQIYEHVVLELIGAACTYLLLRRIRARRSAAAAGAIAYGLCGKFAWFADPTVNPLPFLPMLLLGIERAYAATRAGRPGGWRLIALAGAMSVYAGFPQVAYPDALMGVCWLGWRCGCLATGQWSRFVTKALLGAGAGMLLAAPMLVAMGSYLSAADLGVHSGAQLGAVHLSPTALPQLLLPYVYGQVNADPRATTWIMVGGYVSTALLLPAVFGLLTPTRRGLKLVLLGWTLLVFARMYGAPSLLGHVLGVLPDMARIRFYRYATAALELPVIVLAALGLDDLAHPLTRRLRLLGCAGAVIAVVIACAIYARPVVHSLGPRFHHVLFFDASTLWAAGVVAALAAAALIRAVRVRSGLLTLLVALDALVLFAVPELAAPRAAAIDLAPVSYLRRHLGEARFFTLGPIQPNYGSYFGLASFGVNDFPPKLYAQYVRARADPGVVFAGFRGKGEPSPQWELLHHLAAYRAAGVRYVLTPASDPLPQSPTTLRLVFRSPTARIYRLVGASPFFIAPGCRVSSGELDSAWIVCPRPTTLVRRETWFAGWSARIDGHPVAIHPAARLFQAVTVPAGSHRVTFAFTPPGMDWAALSLLGGCVLMLAPAARGRFATREPAR